MTATKVTFRQGGEFWNELKTDVEAYLSAPGVRENGLRRLHRKAMFIIAWAACSYLALVLAAHTWWQTLLFGVSLVLALNAAAFGIMHDGNHGSFSRSRRVNRVAGFTLELLGGSSFNWRVKHNMAHHTYPNVDGLDEDIDQPPFARLASSQKWEPWYRWQHLYLWFAYGLLTFRWQSVGDTVTMVRGRISRYQLKGLNAFEIGAFAFGKLLFLGWVFALPLALHWSWRGGLLVIVSYAGLNWLFSFVLATTFQLAHCVDEAMFSSADDADPAGKLPNTWAVHQVLATSDFCPRSRIVTWFTGGLNFQLEHHLFPRVAHVHYPEIAVIVRRACERHGLVYLCQPNLRSAVAAHYRHLRNMAQPPQAVRHA